MDNWREWRGRKRTELLVRRESVGKEERRVWSAAITHALKKGFPSLQNSVLGFCWPYRGEYDARPAMRHFHDRGAILALPEIVNAHEGLRFRKWWEGAPMKIGAHKIPVPVNTEPLKVDTVIIPMIGFDAQGFRLGYGGGYFDRTLKGSIPRPVAIGVAFEILRLSSVHPQPHDIAMDFVVTESGIQRVTPSGLAFVSAEECATAPIAKR